MKKNPKDTLEVTIGDGMEFIIHGKLIYSIILLKINTYTNKYLGKTNLKRGKNNLNKSKTIGNSILEHGDFIGHLEDDQISNKSYGSHKNRFKDESHKGSINTLDPDEQEEKRDASKEELGIGEGKQFLKSSL